jgi:hypothetical protein
LTPEIHINYREAREVAELYRKAVGADVPKFLNRAGGSACLRSIKHTPKATVSSITKDLGTAKNPSQLAMNIASAHLGGTKKTRTLVRELAIRIIIARRRSIAYTKAGYIVAARAFGIQPRMTLSSKNIAAKTGYGKKATVNKWIAELFNGAPAAGLFGDALQKGLDETLTEMKSFALRRLDQISRKFSSR